MKVSIGVQALRGSTVAKLALVGGTVGPLVDSLHNQCLLEYDYAPIHIPFPATAANEIPSQFLLASSWAVPPLLAFAYVVLGALLPRIFQWCINQVAPSTAIPHLDATNNSTGETNRLRDKAIWAVATTALIIKLSEFLELHPAATDWVPLADPATQHIAVLLSCALVQWAWLDGTLAALLAACITSLGGPLSELPFVAGDIWHYLPVAGDYVPLQGWEEAAFPFLTNLLTLVLGPDYSSLALSSITGPCYFAVTMDAIALGRWFDAQAERPVEVQEE